MSADVPGPVPPPRAAPVLDPDTFDRRTQGRPLVALLDLDGTLAPIAPRPEDARVPATTRDALARLTHAPGVQVAFVTGRSAADGARLAGVPRTWVVGNHGAETVDPDGSCHVAPEVAAWAEPLARAADLLQRAAERVPGARLEDKRWSLSLHLRLADPTRAAELEHAAESAAAAEGLRLGRGKAVLELRAPVHVDKGTAAVALVRRLVPGPVPPALVVMGDDVTDEDAFRRVAAAFPQTLTVRVGAPDHPTAAAYTVPDVATAADFLVRLAARASGDAPR